MSYLELKRKYVYIHFILGHFLFAEDSFHFQPPTLASLLNKIFLKKLLPDKTVIGRMQGTIALHPLLPSNQDILSFNASFAKIVRKK